MSGAGDSCLPSRSWKSIDVKVAVTGATGFVGRHVVAALLAQGAEVVAAARTIGATFPVNERLRFVKADIDDADRAVSKLGDPDVLIHLAWSGLPNYRSDTHLRSELPRQVAFLNACSRSGLKRLLVTGTCLEYGMQSGQLDEELLAAPTTAYGQAKNQLLEYLQTIADAGGPKLTWLRLFYLYGPGQAATSLYSQLHSAATSGAKEFAMSPGDQKRDFLPIEAAAAYISALAVKTSGEGIVNVCSGSPIRVADLARDWLHKWDSALALNLGVYPYPDYEPRDYWGSSRKLDSLLRTL